MIRLDMPQGSDEWLMARLGIPTASRFDCIITPKTMKPSTSAKRYARELLVERIQRRPYEDASSGFIMRGNLLEQEAVRYYELIDEVNTEAVGFIMRDDGLVGCSPDRFVGHNGLLEIKCPSAEKHLAFALQDEAIETDYRPQVQGQLWLTGREWCDTISYNPGIKSAITRTVRDEKFIAALESAVGVFLADMDVMVERLLFHGYAPELRAWKPNLAIAA